MLHTGWQLKINRYFAFTKIAIKYFLFNVFKSKHSGQVICSFLQVSPIGLGSNILMLNLSTLEEGF